MAVLAPYSLNSPKADATGKIELTWLVSGDLQYAYELEIYVNDGSSTPFYIGNKTSSLDPKASLPESTLINGVEYKWRVRIYNQVDEVSSWSDYAIIITSTTPVATITNASDTLYAQRYQFTGSYSQAESVAIKWFEFVLYQNGAIVEQSPRTYSSDIQTTFFLEDGKQYEVELIVASQHDIIGKSQKYLFNTEYEKPEFASPVVAQNLQDIPGVKVTWVNPTRITLQTVLEPSFVTGKYNQALDLSDGNSVFYEEKFDGDSTVMFWMIMKAASMDFNGPICRMDSPDGGHVEVGYDNVGGRFYIVSQNDGQSVTRGSSNITFAVDDQIFIAFNQDALYVGYNGVLEQV